MFYTIIVLILRYKHINPLNLPMHQTFTLVSSYVKTHKNKQQPEKLVDDLIPSDSIIQNILNYSKSLSIKKSKFTDFIEITSN